MKTERINFERYIVSYWKTLKNSGQSVLKWRGIFYDEKLIKLNRYEPSILIYQGEGNKIVSKVFYQML